MGSQTSAGSWCPRSAPTWEEVLDAYPGTAELGAVLPAVMVQGLLCLSDVEVGSDEALGWARRLEAAAGRL